MKDFIESRMKFYPTIFQTPEKVLEHVFCTLGNGVALDNKGYLEGGYRGNEKYDFGVPKPFRWMYPWSKTERFQPFRDVAGCRDAGFKEACEHFIECVMITPDDVDNAKDWKDNIEVVRDVLLNTPPIEDRYTIDDMELFLSDIGIDDSYVKPPESVSKQWVFEAQSTDTPEDVVAEVRKLWSGNGLGNDFFVYRTELDEELFEEYPKIYFWLKYNDVKENEKVIIHYWW